MSALLATDPDLTAILEDCVRKLRELAESELPPELGRRMHELGENKEFLSEAEHQELAGLVDSWLKRTADKLEAQVLLKRLREKLPTLFESL